MILAGRDSEAIPTRALCPHCDSIRRFGAKLDFTSEDVSLSRESCPSCFTISQSLLSHQKGWFLDALKLAGEQSTTCFQWPSFVIELLEECNLHCPICIAGSGAGKGKVKPLARCSDLLRQYASSNETGELLISGGEPTIHPEFFRVLDLAYEGAWSRIVLVTNGLRIVEDADFAKGLTKYKERLEVHLQYDVLDDAVLLELRGGELSWLRSAAIAVLRDKAIRTTLVSVHVPGMTERYIKDVVEIACSNEFIVGITIQPLRSGKAEGANQFDTSATIDECATIWTENLGLGEDFFQRSQFAPFNYWFGFIDRQTKMATSNSLVTDGLAFPNAISDCCDTLRIGILSHADKESYFEAMGPGGLIGIATKGLSIVSLDRYYLGLR